ncbi:MAG: hypothetical protein AB7N80_12030 [Bdellovibrionales bacterium]
MRKLTSQALALVILILGFSLTALAASPSDKKTERQSNDKNFELLQQTCSDMLTGAPIARYDHLNRHWTLADLLNPNAELNLAVLHPTVIMNADQRIWYTANWKKPRKVRDPAYRIENFTYYPVINEGITEANRAQIIGHYETIQRAMNVIKARASGKRSGKMVGFIGPAGTGKTELLNLLAKASSNLAMSEPAYYRFTFEFVGLDVIPALRPLSYGGDEEGVSAATKNITLNRSPFVLLPPHLQARVLEIASPAFRERMDMNPLPIRIPSKKTQRVIDEIMGYYAKKEGLERLTDKDYMRFLSRHVRIVRQTFDGAQPTTIIRYLGKNPNMDALFFSERMTLEQIFGPDDPLSYSYGLIPSNDGEGLYIDEFFRQGAEVRDSTLDLAQNGIAQSNGSPPEQLDITMMFATNDASIEEAKQNGGAAAHLDRTVRLPMRHAIEPWHVAKIAMQDLGIGYFKMAALHPVIKSDETDAENKSDKQPADDLVAYSPQDVFPDREDGAPVGPDGRFALYHQSTPNEKPVMIAPRTTMFLGLTAVATRLVTDEQAFEQANQKSLEFHTYAKFKQYFTDPASRLQVLTGQVAVNNTLLAELGKARSLLKEGQNGIGAREVENWFSEALATARSRGVSLTPVILDEVFERLINGDGITVTAKDRPHWKALHKLIKEKFILPALTADVLNILQGQGRVESIYDDIKREIFQLSNDESSDYVQGEGNQRSVIDKKRLNEIYQLYLANTGQQFDPGMLKNFHLSQEPNSAAVRHPQLLEAVRTWLARREMEQTSIAEIMDYYEGRPISETARLKGEQSENQLAAYGYDRHSFMQALRFVKETQFEVERKRGAGN